jgi:O-antigen/teichoic acid export membrane protein
VKPFDENGAWLPALDRGDLRLRAIWGAGITAVTQSSRIALQVIATVVLARLLKPADFGLLAMVTTFSLLFMNFGMNGFTEAVVQRESIDHALASNLFWITLAIALCLAIGFAACGPLLASFYGDQRVTGIAVATALTIPFTSLSVLHLALLKRAMRFSVLSLNEIVAQTSSITVSIVLAWRGWGYWALAAGAVALQLATSAGAWTLCRWVPSRPRRREGTGASAAFAITTYAHFAMNYCTRNVDNLLVGWFFGPESLGFYKKAYDLFLLPVSQLSTPLYAVAVPTLSRLTGEPETYRRYVLRTLSTLALIGMGLGGVMTLIGKELILLLLGPKWTESGKIFAFFGPGIGVMLIYVTHGWIHLSLGRADRWLGWGVAEFVVTGLLFLLGLRWGPAGVATAWVVSFWVLTIPSLCYAGKPAHLRVAAVVGAVWKYAVASAVAGCASAVLIGRPHPLPTGPVDAMLRIAGISAVFGTLYIFAVILLYRGSEPLYQLAALVRDVVAPGRHRAILREQALIP